MYELTRHPSSIPAASLFRGCTNQNCAQTSLTFRRNFLPVSVLSMHLSHSRSSCWRQSPFWCVCVLQEWTQSDIKSVSDLKHQLSQVSIPMVDISPDKIHEWLSAFTNSIGTTSEMLLCSTLASTSALIGLTKVKPFSSYEENGNLFVLIAYH